MISRIIGFGLLGLIVLGAIIGIGQYNSLAKASNAVDGQWKQVEVQYQRRFDLIPNLVESVKGAQQQEQKVFSDIADARTRYAGAQSITDRVAAANDLESSLGRLLVITENYPELRSNQNVMSLMDELSGTENRISVERGRYNTQVQNFNTRLSTFPTSFTAKMFGYQKKDYFDATSGSENTPKVDLNS